MAPERGALSAAPAAKPSVCTRIRTYNSDCQPARYQACYEVRGQRCTVMEQDPRPAPGRDGNPLCQTTGQKCELA
jgi:hypothetical protein